MWITCPYCHADARLTLNPAHTEQDALPLYRLSCSGCARTSVRSEPAHGMPILGTDLLVRGRSSELVLHSAGAWS